MIVQYQKVQNNNLKADFEKIKELINSQISEFNSLAKLFFKWSIFLSGTAGYDSWYMGLFANRTQNFIYSLKESWNKKYL